MNEERYCTVAESLNQSLKEMKLIRQGELEKQSFWDVIKELESEIDEQNTYPN